MSTRLAIGALALSAAVASGAAPSEDAYRANNVGVAMLEQVRFAEGAESFRQALKLDPGLDIAQINLAIALFNVPEAPAALREAQAAVARAPRRPQAHYVLGLASKSLNKGEDAIAAFQKVLELDPDDVGANINLGQLLVQEQRYADAVAALKHAVAIEPYNSTAVYSLATALLRSGQREAGQEQMKRFQALREAGYATSLSQNYPMQGRYAEAVVSTGAEPALVDPQTPAVKLVDVTAAQLRAGKPAGAATKAAAAPRATLFDLDADGDLDLAAVVSGRVRLYRNDKGVFAEATPAAGFALAGGTALGTLAGDYDNDGKADLLVLSDKGLRLFHNDGAGRLSDATVATGVPAYANAAAAAFVDADHDGDLDVFAVAKGGAAAPANLLLRNDGRGKLADAAAEAKLKAPAGGLAVVPTDFDNHRDVDLLVAREDGVALFQNLRDGSFRDVAAEAALKVPGRISAVAAGDLNKDGYTDFFFAREDGPGSLALSDGKERFALAAAPESAAGATAAQLLDYDNDGLLDLVLATAKGLRVLRNLGDKWTDVSAAAVPADLASPRTGEAAVALAAGDLDGDGDTDLVVSAVSGLKMLRNEGGEKNAALRVILTGKGSNRVGVGSKVEARAGSLRSRLELYSAFPAPAPADLVFGLGKRAAVDAVRVLWPSGTLQAETELPALTRTAAAAPVRTIEELDRTPSSCPYLFAWNGQRFGFVTDFMGGGEMGAWLAPGVRNTPDPEEYVRIRGDQLKERDGRLELRITHELEEVLYVDRLELLAIAHPEGVEVFPNEGLSEEPKPFKLYTGSAAQPPLSAVDDEGRNVLPLVRDLDGRAVDGFPLLPIRGYAETHTLTLDLGKPARSKRLLLTGWTEYAFSSDNVAASQSGLQAQPPVLQARDADGRWKTIVADVGFPVGRPQTIVVDLTGKLAPRSREVRLVTNMCVYWDQIRVDTSAPAALSTPERLPPAVADLRWRGFSAPAKTAGRTTLDFEYRQVTSANTWKMMPGRYTREGDVRPLLSQSDDRFVICRPGDEIGISFDATALLPVPRGWTRTYLLHVDGFSKEMNLHSASPDVVAPLPFHGMKRYPYGPADAPARSEAYLEYLEAYNTRLVFRGLPLLETVVAEAATSGSGPGTP
jgi:tetratricopeptide (TPR) repeat protein